MAVVEGRDGETSGRGVYGWALRMLPAYACESCGAAASTGYQLRRLTDAGWIDVAGQRWCLRCWSAQSAVGRYDSSEQ